MHLNRASTVFAIVLLCYHVAIALKASDLFKICNRNDPQLNDCIKGTLEELRFTLKSGISQLSVPSVDPMVIPKVRVFQGSGPVSIDSTFTNLHVEGITNFEITKVTADIEKYRLDFEVAIPYLHTHGDYKIDGRVLVLPISGSGDSWSNYTDVTGTASLIGHKETRDGQDYMKLDEFKFHIEVGHASIHMNKLFNGNKLLGDAMNNFMSRNWEVVFQELKPVVDEAISAIFTDAASKVFDRFPFAELFPSS